MEGLGSRLGRASSRYGPTVTTVFNGPVRKWRKKWVHVARSQPSTISYDHTVQSNGQNSLLLRRWTPTTVPGDDVGTPTEEPPRRKFRYIPTVVLEKQRKVAEKKTQDKAKSHESDQSSVTPENASNDAGEKPNIHDGNDGDDDLKKEIMVTEKSGSQWSNASELDLSLDSKSTDDDDGDNGVDTTAG